MHATVVVSIALGLAWIVAACIALASLALAATKVGRDYVFTQPGILRLGPPNGRNIAATKFTHGGVKIPIRRFLSQSHPSLLVFLANFGKDEARSRILIDGLQRFYLFCEGHLEIVIFCTAASDRIAKLVSNCDGFAVVDLADSDLPTKLNVRAFPYALLIHPQGSVLGKGLVNHLEHLCLLAVRGGVDQSGIDSLKHLDGTCTAHLQQFRLPQVSMQ